MPSQIAAGACLREVVAGLNGQEIVIKPTVGASALHTVRGVAGSPELDQAMDDLPDIVYLVQPFQPEILTDGEWSLMFIDGEYTHAVVKRPAAGDYRVQEHHGGHSILADPRARGAGRCPDRPGRQRVPRRPTPASTAWSSTAASS